ncbi:MAG: aldolase catalytic domain-containing protein [Planctomycetes bacterium]|nr:aldolase catalytic domain-containing protein [Planctomycetota bacterium]
MAKGTWLTYRPDIKILDCTIRDGGLINNHMFEDGIVKAVYDALVKAGIDYMEMGYKADKKIFAQDEYGRWKYCDEDDIRRIVGDNATGTKISVMADAERTDYHNDILPKNESVVDAYRIATYIHQIPTALDMIKDAHDKGYETILQLMAVSIVQERELEEALQVFAETPVSAVYIVDSFGAFYSEQVRDLTVMYMKALEQTGKEVGIHAHNNQQLAYANTIEALIVGASRLDATMNGIGRGAGNCPLELIVGFLKNPKFHIRPILEAIRDVCEPLKAQMEWGYMVPYMITGQLNRHPRTAIAMRAGGAPTDYVKFYDGLMEEES